MEKHTLRIGLDWWPNGLHAGLLLGQALGLYDQQGLQLELVDPSADDYATLPTQKLVAGELDLAFGPPESYLQMLMQGQQPHLLGALLQADTSRLALQPGAVSSGHLVFSQLGIPFEQQVYSHLAQQLGCSHSMVQLGTLHTWSALLQGGCTAAWIFYTWEGAEAQAAGYRLQLHSLASLGVPYPACPLMITTQAVHARKQAQFETFMQVSQQAYHLLASHPEGAIPFILPFITSMEEAALVLHLSLQAQQPHWFDGQGRWGHYPTAPVLAYGRWLGLPV